MGIEDFLKTTHSNLNNDLKFAETKNTSLITFNSAMIGLTAKALFEQKHPCSCVNNLTSISLFLLLIPVVISLLSFMAARYPKEKQAEEVDEHEPAMEEKNKASTNTGRKKKKIAKNPERLAYYEYLHDHYPSCDPGSNAEYLEAFAGINVYKPNLQTARQIVDLARICHWKFKCFNIAIFIELPAIFFWGVMAIIRATI